MRRNLVVCCDGTGNEYGERNTNVIKLHAMLVRDDSKQLTFYDPGVGTFSVRPVLTKFARMWHKSLGLAFGLGLRQNITDAYAFLMRNYRQGDRVYIFGFSRGAYTARVVAALLRGVGLLRVEHENLIPYALRYLEMEPEGIDFKRLAGFRKEFARDDKIEPLFLGLWDTVSSVSWLWDYLSYAFTANNKSVDVLRHAVSIDERRAFFRTNLWRGNPPRQDVKQVWFVGVHCDVGGSYLESESGLSKVALEWMVVEAKAHGLLIVDDVARQIIYSLEPPSYAGKIHQSLKGLWWFCELWPKRSYVEKVEKRRLRFNLGRRRSIQGCPHVHESVLHRMANKDYDPSNLPTPCEVEPWVPFDPTISPPTTGILPPLDHKARICAARSHNQTSIHLEAGKRYCFSATGTWFDWHYENEATGSPSPNMLMKMWAPFRRMPRSNWFSLIGDIGGRRTTRFDIGKLIAHNETYQPTMSGTLYCYANDVPFLYWNNTGEILLEVQEVVEAD